MATEPRVSWDEKVSIEPDLGDQRRSTYKALPAPPKTPKRVMKKYRFSAVFPIVLSLAAFVLMLVLVLAGQHIDTFQSQYLVAVNTSSVGQDIIVIESANTTAVGAVASSTASSSLDPLQPTAMSDLLHELGDTLSDLSGNLTNAVNTGLGDTINGVVKGVADQIGVQDHYYIYLQKVCFGKHAALRGSNGNATQLSSCRSWDQAGKEISNLSDKVHSSIVIGQTRISVPLLAELMSSSGSILDSLNSARKATFAFLIVALVGSVLSTISMLPAMYFPHSRLLIYVNLFWPALATIFVSVAAFIISVVSVLARLVDDFGSTVGVQVEHGILALLFVWISVVSMALSTLYWATVWFVETRKSSFVKRCRDEDEVGHWRGIRKEVWRDIKGRRRNPSMRTDM